MADTTAHTVIYHGIMLHDGMDPVSAAGWATLENVGHDLEQQLIDHSIRQLIMEQPGMDANRIRMIEFSWTDLGPVKIPEEEDPE